MLAAAGFAVLHERERHDDQVTVIIDLDDGKNAEMVEALRLNGDSVVVLASEADTLDLDNDLIAPLSGILTYDLSVAAFIRLLRLICAEERVFPCDPAAGRSLAVPSPASEARSDGNRLSPREREMLSHLLAGHANKVIAQQLGTSEVAVTVHLRNLLRKIKVDNRTQAAIWALSNLPKLEPTQRGLV